MHTVLRFKKYLLPAVVFTTGACVLVIEIVAVRILSPYFGNSIFTVSSVLSVILAALSFGYYVGGKKADAAEPSERWFFGVIFVSGIVVLVMQFMSVFVLGIATQIFSLVYGPLFSAIVLFFLPGFLLGLLSPYAIALQQFRFSEQGIGTITGVMFFWSTFGSIAGSVLAGFVLIPTFGVTHIMLAVAVLLVLLGGVPLLVYGIGRKMLASGVLLFIFSFSLAGATAVEHDPDIVAHVDGQYQTIRVRDGERDGRPTRFLHLDRSFSGARFLDSDDPLDLVFDYSHYVVLHRVFASQIEEALVLGGGAFSITKALLHELPDAHVTVAEIEPALFEIGEVYFDLPDDARISRHATDGRQLLARSDATYDFIFNDAFSSFMAAPMHLSTREFLQLVYDRLNENGVYMMNAIGDVSGATPSFALSEMKTFQETFPNSYFFAVRDPEIPGIQNIILVGIKNDRVFAFDAYREQEGVLGTLPEQQIMLDDFDLREHPVFTDEYAPVDYFLAQSIERDAQRQ